MASLSASPRIVFDGASFVGKEACAYEDSEAGSWADEVGRMRGKSRAKESDFKWDSSDESIPVAKSAEIPALINWHPDNLMRMELDCGYKSGNAGEN